MIHFLQKNVRSARPCHLIFVDVETNEIPLEGMERTFSLRLGYAEYVRIRRKTAFQRESSLFFSSTDQFWDWVERLVTPKSRYYLIAHNVTFDFRVLRGFSELAQRGWSLQSFYSKGMTTILRFKRGNVSLHVIDNMNLFAVPLAQLGKTVNLEKKEIDFAHCADEQLAEYCRNDVRIMVAAWAMWLDFLEAHDLGDFRETIASQAFTAYRHRFMDYPIIIHDNEEAIALERRGYRGARVECFVQGEFTDSTYYLLDVNAMYSHVMSSFEWPRELLAVQREIPIELLRYYLSFRCVIADVLVKVAEPVFPTLIDEHICYPIGTFHTTLTTPELKYAIERNWVKHVALCAIYRKSRILSSYADYFWRLRQEYESKGQLTFAWCCKLMANALYGKFGQRGLKDKIIGNCEANACRIERGYDLSSHERYEHYYVGGKVFERRASSGSYNSFVAIAAEITARGRMRLWELIKIAGRMNVLYCDTDSLIVNERGYQQLQSEINPGRLGALKVSASGAHLIINAPKDYRLDNLIIRKGIKKSAIEIAPNEFEQDQFLGVSGMFERQEPDLITVKKIRKRLARRIFSGKLQRNGRIKPFLLLFPLLLLYALPQPLFWLPQLSA